jgi:hypothetical protein
MINQKDMETNMTAMQFYLSEENIDIPKDHYYYLIHTKHSGKQI